MSTSVSYVLLNLPFFRPNASYCTLLLPLPPLSDVSHHPPSASTRTSPLTSAVPLLNGLSLSGYHPPGNAHVYFHLSISISLRSTVLASFTFSSYFPTASNRMFILPKPPECKTIHFFQKIIALKSDISTCRKSDLLQSPIFSILKPSLPTCAGVFL